MSESAAARLTESATTVGVRSLPFIRKPAETLLSFDQALRHYNAKYENTWQVEVLDKLYELLQLPPDWDGQSAPVVRRDAAMFVLEVLGKVMQPHTPLPQVVPSSVGGIQIEWHEAGIDLEFHIAAPYECELWFEDHQSGCQPVSLEMNTADFTALRDAVSTLTKR